MTDTRTTEITFRRMDLDPADREAVARLADLDTRPTPEGRILGAEIDDRLLAAVAIDGGALIADPFERTTELRAMLELRARQLRGRERFGGLRRIARRRGAHGVGVARASHSG